LRLCGFAREKNHAKAQRRKEIYKAVFQIIMQTNIFRITSILLVTLLVACNKIEEETFVLITVDAETVWLHTSDFQWQQEFPTEFMRVTEMISGEVILMYFSQIEGFRYEKGFEYQLKVMKTNERLKCYTHPVSPHYALVEIISKKEVDVGGTIISLIVSAEMEWGYLTTEHSTLSPLFFLVKEVGTDEWERYPTFISNFIGLDYELGFENLIKVKKFPVDPPQHFGELDFILNHTYWYIE